MSAVWRLEGGYTERGWEVRTNGRIHSGSCLEIRAEIFTASCLLTWLSFVGSMLVINCCIDDWRRWRSWRLSIVVTTRVAVGVFYSLLSC